MSGPSSGRAVRELARMIDRALPARPVRVMHVCGTHEHSLSKHALRSILPARLELIAGPGCPVCVCPAEDIEAAVGLAERGVTVVSFGDMLRVPSASGSLEQARGRGARVVMAGSSAEAVGLAGREGAGEVVFFAVGFETTACTFAAAALGACGGAAQAGLPAGFSMLTSLRTIPQALRHVARASGGGIDGYLLPGHVCTVTGIAPYEPIAAELGVPMVAAGFEPADLMLAILAIASDIGNGLGVCRNAYARSVCRHGNSTALEMMARAFEPQDAAWRGIGLIAGSGLALRRELERVDARSRYGIAPAAGEAAMPEGCACGSVLVGRARPVDCGLFATGCTPGSPVGPCMVSHEGTCRIAFEIGGAP